jgi:hypothetical protein
METVQCDNDSFEGGWTKIFTYSGEQVIDDRGVVSGSLPSWYKNADGAPFDQYLWIDEGTELDFNRNGGDWNAKGYDTGKHYFFAADGSNWKIRDRGIEDNWSFKDQCNTITDYQLEGDTGLCMHGNEN